MTEHGAPRERDVQVLAPARLTELEAVIERGRQTFVEVGLALLEIRDSRLYRESHPTFEDYCRERWGWSRIHAHRQIEAAQVAAMLPTGNTAPDSERQARELVPLARDDEQAAVEVWRDLREQYGDKVTAERVREAVQKRLGNGMAVHYTSDTPEWYTPPEIVAAVRSALGGIDLDPCSNAGEPNVPARRHFTVKDDGLAQAWRGRVYMNPPYGDVIADWVAKLREEYTSGRVTAAIALVPARTDTAWWALLRDSVLCLVRGRLRFSESAAGAPFPSAVAYMGKDPDRFARSFRDMGDIWKRVR